MAASDSAAAPKPAAAGREELIARLRERIVAFAASRISRDAAEDLAQEVMLVVHTKYAHLDRIEDLLPVCLKILRFKMAAAFRKAHRHGEYSQLPIEDMPLPDGDPSPETWLERKEMAERLARAVAHLGGRCKELLRLKLEGKSFAEIRAALGASTLNTVYTWDFRCRKRLLELMGGNWEKRA